MHPLQSKGVFHCFGCGAKGPVIDWQMKTAGQTLQQAVAFLKAHLTVLRDDEPPGDAGKIPFLVVSPSALPRPKMADLGDDSQELLSQVTDHYHRQLLDSPEAMDWLVRRGLSRRETGVDRLRQG